MGQNDEFRLALTGDSIVMRDVTVHADEPSRQLLGLIRAADVAFTNLEVLPNNFRGDPALESGGSHFAAPDRVLDVLLNMGFDLFSAANNHSLDYSISGLLSTMDELERRGMHFAGIGRTLEESRMPAYVERAGGTTALIACSSTFAKGQEAGAQRPDMQGRPGLNPLHVETTYEVTPEQLVTLRTIAEQLDVERQRLETIQLGFAFPPDDPDVFPFLKSDFRAAEQPAVRTRAKEKDVEALAKWVREARNRADLVIVSLHAYEQGGAKEEPAEFIPAFGKRMIDEGADVVVGHGPHLLRGMELHRGKPIFYSLGNFIGQNELTYKLPADSYDQFRVDHGETPGEVYRQRTEHDQKGFPSDPRYWETVMPVCSYRDGRLSGITIYPVTLGLGEAVHRRGRPRLAQRDEARAILARFAALSAPFGTTMEIGDGVATVAIA